MIRNIYGEINYGGDGDGGGGGGETRVYLHIYINVGSIWVGGSLL